MTDLRRTGRFPLLLTVRSGEGRFLAENLGGGGMFVATEQPYRVGELLPLHLAFPGLLDPVSVEVRVAWVRPAGPGQSAGVGVAISDTELARQPRFAELARAVDGREALLPLPADPYRILIADDSPNTAELYRYAMRRLAAAEWGNKGGLIEVGFASDGAQAWAQLQTKPPRLLITDLYMPVLDGFGLIERIRRNQGLAELRILVISAGDDESLERAMALGADGVMHKPAQVNDVVYTARALLRLRARRGVGGQGNSLSPGDKAS